MFIFSSRRRHTRYIGDWSSDVCSSDLAYPNWDPVDREFDRRNLADGVLVLERGHEQPAVTPVDARFDEVVQMPHESPWPPVLALALSLVFLMLVIGRYGVAGLMWIVCLLA